MLLRAMEGEGQGQPQQQPKNQIVNLAKKGKDAKDLYDTIKGMTEGSAATEGASALSSLGSSGGMSTLGSSVPSVPGFTGVEEMVGNGLFSEAPGSMMMSQAPQAAGAFDLAGIGGAGNAYLPLAGAAGMYDLFKNNRIGKRGYLQGAASGAAMGSFFGPIGIGIGAGVGLAAGGANELLDTNRYKKEGNRLAGLEKKGIKIPESMKTAMTLNRGRSKEELMNPGAAKDFTGFLPDGTWVNNKFAQSRNEADLTKNDIAGYAAFSEKFGGDWWDKFNSKQREDIAQAVLDRKAVNEHHGTIDINWNPELDDAVNKIIAGGGNPEAGQPQQPTFKRPGKGQVARVSAGMYMNDKGQVVRSNNSQGAMRSSYQIPRTGRK